MSKVFISYSNKDEAFAHEVFNRLKQEGVECFLDKASIPGGANWLDSLGKNLDDCDFFLCILTPDYCRSEWAGLEISSVVAKDPSSLKKKIVPLMRKECKKELPWFLRTTQCIDVSTDTKWNNRFPGICRQLGGKISAGSKEEAGRGVDRGTLPPVCDLPGGSLMPYRSLEDVFFGREKDLWALDDGLRQRKTAVVQGIGVVMGMGGIGKSQLAVEYVHRYGCHYPGGVFWVDAEQGISTMIANIANAAGLDIDYTRDEKTQLHQLWQQLGTRGAVLLVLDNFPEQEPPEPWQAPLKSVYTLVTTRRKDFFNYFCLSLDTLDRESALQLLNSGPRRFGAGAYELAAALEGLPLALELAKHFLNLRPTLSVEELLEEMKQMGQMEVLDIFTRKYKHQLPTGHEKEVAATFRLGWESCGDFEKRVLQAISLLGPFPVPRWVLRRALDLKPGTKSKLRDPLDEAISRLNTGLSMLELDKARDPRMHRLTAAFVQLFIEKDDLPGRDIIKAVIEEMGRVTDDQDTSAFRELEKVLPHGDFLLTSQPAVEPGQEVDLGNYMMRHHRKWGRYRLAERYGRRSLSAALGHFEPGHPEIAISQSNLALVLADLGELEEAKALLKTAYTTFLEKLGPRHPHTQTAKNNLDYVKKKKKR
jgi:hypothetical protein